MWFIFIQIFESINLNFAKTSWFDSSIYIISYKKISLTKCNTMVENGDKEIKQGCEAKIKKTKM